MNLFSTKNLCAVTAALFMATGASAATMFLTDAVPGAIPTEDQGVTPENDVLDFLYGGTPNDGIADVHQDGYFGATVNFNVGTRYLVEYYGSESGADNRFVLGADELAGGKPNTSSRQDYVPLDGATDSFIFTAAEIVVPFKFTFAFLGNTAEVENGSNVLPVGPADAKSNFFANFGPDNQLGLAGNELWLFFDGEGNAGDNHDDLVIRITGIVPLPAGGLLLLTALGGLGLARRRAKAS